MKNLMIFLILVFVLNLSATIINIPENFDSIQEGLNFATEGDTILVAEGIYYENIIWPETAEIKLFGNNAETTIIDANGNGSVIRFENNLVDTVTVVANFTIQNASEKGIYCYSSNPKLSNLIIQNNSGGGVYCNNVSPVRIINSIIRNNTTDLYGGGIRCSYTSNAVLLNCSIYNNSADSMGGGVSATGGSELVLINCLLHSNTANKGGATFCGEKGAADFINCTIVENFAYDFGGAIYTHGMSPSVLNSIIWNNEPNQIQGNTIITYSDIQDFWVGEGNIDEDPLFVGTGDFPFSLQDLSTCINSGIPDTTGLNLPEYDLAGNQRIYGERIDMGAYENQNVIVKTNDNTIPSILQLSNYPNPFNPTTTIEFSIQNDSQIELSIYNIKGQKIKTLAQNEFTKGSHSIIWNGDDDNNKPVSSGVYLYKLNINGKTEAVKKCLLLK